MSDQPSRLPHIIFAIVGIGAATLGAWWSSQPASPSNTNQPAVQASAPTASQASSAVNTTHDVVPADFWTQTFDTPNGKTLTLSQYKGKPILLNFWASWCPPCVKEMPDLDHIHKDMKAKGWQVIGLAVDGPTPVREFLTKVPVGFDIGLAGFGGTELSQALGNTAGGLPFTVIIDADGRIVHRKVGGTTYAELKAVADAL